MIRSGLVQSIAKVFAIGAVMVCIQSSHEVRADPILSTVGDTSFTATKVGFGQEITIGISNNVTVTSVVFYQAGSANTSETFSIYGSGGPQAPGAVALDSNFTPTYTTSPATYVTETANTTFTLLAGQTYYLYLNAGTSTNFSFTSGATNAQINAPYSTIDGKVSYNGSTYTTGDTSTTAIFALNGTLVAVPEPSSLSLAAIAGVLGSVVAYRRRRQAARISG